MSGNLNAFVAPNETKSRRFCFVGTKFTIIKLLAIVLLAFWFGVSLTVFVMNEISSGILCDGVACNISSSKTFPESIKPTKVHITRLTKTKVEAIGEKKLIFLYGKHVWNKYDLWDSFDWSKCTPSASKCRITSRPEKLSRSDAVVYNSMKMPGEKVVDQHKKYFFLRVFLSGITPAQTNFSLEIYHQFFDLSITYKSESDIRIPYWPNDGTLPAMFRPKPPSKTLDKEQMLDLDANLKNYFTRFGKEDFMAFTITNCSGQHFPNLFVGKLREEGLIDIFSTVASKSCKSLIKETMNLPCAGTDDCVKHFERYKFVIINDDSLCRDYTSSDYWRAILAWHAVPLLYGAGNYSKHLVPGSFIDAVAGEDYISPSFKKAHKHRDNYLSYYEKFHIWREEGRVERFYWQCELCERLHGEKTVTKLDMVKFWDAEKDCGEKLETHEQMRLQLVRTGVIK